MNLLKFKKEKQACHPEQACAERRRSNEGRHALQASWFVGLTMTHITLILILPSSLLLSGCLGTIIEIMCEASPDSDHCYQASAVQESDPENCEKIGGKDFKGSNPPKDKCFLQIAENSGDPSVCDKIEGGFMSYSKSECLENTLKTHGPEDCKKADDEMACRLAYAKNGKDCGDGFEYKGGACVVRKEDPADDDIETKAAKDLNTIKDAATGKYMDLLTKAIENETDDHKKAGLEAYKEFLEKSGDKLEKVQTTVDTLKQIKQIFLDSYDPKMDIANMPVNKILDPGLFDRIKDRIFGAGTPSARDQADSGLEVYEAMLKRQSENDFLQKGRLERLQDVVTSKLKDEGTSKVKEGVKDVAEGIAGTAFMAVGIVDHALTSFQEAAQKEMFVGLASAYNRRRDAIQASNPGLSPEEIHKRTVAQVKDDPYQDIVNTGFVKYGNLLENGDCKDANNPPCIDNRVFWTAMDKTYQYNHAKQ